MTKPLKSINRVKKIIGVLQGIFFIEVVTQETEGGKPEKEGRRRKPQLMNGAPQENPVVPDKVRP
jgi:hypothetical protein